MKYKHGFIGNSSSASYYIRRSAHGRVDRSPVVPNHGNENTEVIFSGGKAWDSYYSWHPKTTAKMRTSVVTSVRAGEGEGSIDGVKSITFEFYAYAVAGHHVRGYTPGSSHCNKGPLHVQGSATIATTAATGRKLTQGTAWTVPATPGAGIVFVGVTNSQSLPHSNVTLTATWTGSLLKINGTLNRNTGNATMSCAIGIHNLSAIQDEKSS